MNFTKFTDLFPKTKLPVDFGEETYRKFEEKNNLLPDEAIASFIAPLEPELDAYTEVLPCIKFTYKNYIALVYWKAGLLHNHYRLVTFDKKGNPVDNKVIAGSYTDREETTTSAGTINKDRIIYVVSGSSTTSSDIGNAQDSAVIRLHIDDNGVINELGTPSQN